MTVYLIGWGIYDIPLFNKRIEDIIQSADEVYFERYTNPYPYGNRVIEKLIGRKCRELKREDLEERSLDILLRGKDRKIVIITFGDPLIATTHQYLIIEAAKYGIEVKIIHSASAVCSAMGESGLHIYKFGPISTVIRPKKASSKRCYDVLIDNLKRGLHTLILLEYDYSENYFMHPTEAIKILKSYDKYNLLREDYPIIVICGLGWANEFKRAVRLRQILNKSIEIPKDIPCILIFPGELHFTEEEYMRLILGLE